MKQYNRTKSLSNAHSHTYTHTNIYIHIQTQRQTIIQPHHKHTKQNLFLVREAFGVQFIRKKRQWLQTIK